MWRLDEGMWGMSIQSAEALELGSSNQKNSTDPKMILAYSCPRGWTTPWSGRSCLLLSPETKVSPISVDGAGVLTFPSPPTWQAPIDPLKHPTHHI